jgi:acyl carrier protein
VHERLQKVFRIVFDDDALVLRDEMTAKDIEDWDSLRHISLLVAVEREFNIKFSLREVKKLVNVGELKKLISGKVNI